MIERDLKASSCFACSNANLFLPLPPRQHPPKPLHPQSDCQELPDRWLWGLWYSWRFYPVGHQIYHKDAPCRMPTEPTFLYVTRTGDTKGEYGCNLFWKNNALQACGVPYGIRTRVAAVKGQCPRPLDERDKRQWTVSYCKIPPDTSTITGYEIPRVCDQSLPWPRAPCNAGFLRFEVPAHLGHHTRCF